MSAFKKAERKQAKLKLMLSGPSGSGKTYSALRLASGIGKRIAMIDTENGSASLYAESFDFEVLNIEPPYTIPKYTAALQAAAKEGFDVVIVDSTTHAWAGDGGLLSKKEALDSRGGNSFTNWAGISKEHTQFVAALLHSPFHLIATVRSKQEYVIEQNEKGKQAPRKVGLAPIQRDGLEYEFTTVFDVAMDHNAAASKDRTGMFDGEVFKITEETGDRFVKWLSGAKAEEAKPAPHWTEDQDEPSKPAEVYRVPFGKKYIGKTMEEIANTDGPDGIAGYIRFLEESSNKDKKPLSQEAIEFISQGEKFLAAWENQRGA